MHWVGNINSPACTACKKYKEICEKFEKLGDSYFKDKSTPNVIYFEIEGNVFYEYSSLSSSKQLKALREKGMEYLDVENVECRDSREINYIYLTHTSINNFKLLIATF